MPLMTLVLHPFGLPHYAQNSHFPYPELIIEQGPLEEQYCYTERATLYKENWNK